LTVVAERVQLQDHLGFNQLFHVDSGLLIMKSVLNDIIKHLAQISQTPERRKVEQKWARLIICIVVISWKKTNKNKPTMYKSLV
jgi:hypothetical protein